MTEYTINLVGNLSPVFGQIPEIRKKGHNKSTPVLNILEAHSNGEFPW